MDGTLNGASAAWAGLIEGLQDAITGPFDDRSPRSASGPLGSCSVG